MMCGGVAVPVALRPENGMHLNAADIEAAVTDRTRAIIINSPGNPSGAVTTAEELAQVAEVCKKHNIWAISDEVYHSIVYSEGKDGRPATAPSIAAVPGMKARTIVVESLSKTYAMTGWRIGYLLAPTCIIEQTSKIAEMVHSSVNSVSQYAGVAAMTGPQELVEDMRQEYFVKRQIVVDELAGCSKLSLIEPEGAFYVYPNLTAFGMTSEDFCAQLLKETHVAIVPGTAFGDCGEGFARISYAYSVKHIKTALERIEKFTSKLGG